MSVDPADFYTGLVAELYEPLASGITDSHRFIEFVRRYGQPALEMCCGTGLPLLDLVAAELHVEGLDSSPDMLAQCQRKAQDRGLEVKLHLSKMQNFDSIDSYRSVYIANGSITLLPDDESLKTTLQSIHRCLKPAGVVLIDLDMPNVDALRDHIGLFRECYMDGFALRVGITSLEQDDDGQGFSLGLRYEREASDGALEVCEHSWVRRIWQRDQFHQHLNENGFDVIEEIKINGNTLQLCARKST